jgi:hypothetical protein
MADDRVFDKCARRLIPFITLIFFSNFLDRANAGFAALTMNKDLGFTLSVFGFGVRVLFVSYSLCNGGGHEHTPQAMSLHAAERPGTDWFDWL